MRTPGQRSAGRGGASLTLTSYAEVEGAKTQARDRWIGLNQCLVRVLRAMR
jgi:hypothetical protein